MPYLNLIQISPVKRIISLAFLLVLVAGLCHAQQADSLNKSLKIGSFGFNMGACMLTEPTVKLPEVWLKEFNTLAPHNSYLNKDLDTSGYTLRSRQGGFSFHCFMNLKTGKGKNRFAKSAEHRISLYYTALPRYQLGFFKPDSMHRDTFFSNTTGYVKIDSTASGHGYYYNLKGHSIGLDFSEIIYPFKWKVLRPYTGITVGTGISLSSLTVAYNPTGEAYWKNRHSGIQTVNSDAQQETSRFKPGFSGYVSLPVGIALYRKTKPTQISFFVEGRFGLRYETYASKHYRVNGIYYVQAGLKLIRN